MDRRFVTVLGVSLLFALVVAAVFYQVSARARGASRNRGQIQWSPVVVASVPLPVGVTVSPTDVKVVKLERDRSPKGAFRSTDQVIGRPVISSILLDEPLVEARLGERGSGAGLAPTIPVGMRAVSVRVNEVVGVAGFVLPGMRVDVLVTLRLAGDNAARTNTVLQNILVLSAGQNLQPDSSGKAVNVPVVTLLVSPEQAETLTLAGSEGRIQLVLRNGSDRTIEKTSGREVIELIGRRPEAAGQKPRPRPRPEPVPAAPPPLLPRDEILVIRGTQKTVEVLGENQSN